MSLISEGQELWNNAYERGGNICFYPHEEIIRFINKYVRKRKSIYEYDNIMSVLGGQVTSLDLGCGIGRHVKFLDEFALNPYGIDLSDTAIDMGKVWLESIGRKTLAERLIVASVTELPFKDKFFDVCVSHGVFDSMTRDIAKQGMEEVYRVLKHGGLMYFDLIMDIENSHREEIVNTGYEKDTIQSYFTVETIKEFIGTEAEILEFKIITWQNEFGWEGNRRAHLVIKRK